MRGLKMDARITAEEARRLVNRVVVPELGTGLGAREPDLGVRGQATIWRVPVVLSLPRLGDVGEVGVIEVDAMSGRIVSEGMDRERILQNAQMLYASADRAK
jgi:hypothetical protein